MRKLLLALFATAAAVPTMASAQDNEDRGNRFEHRAEIGAQPGRERVRPQNPDHAGDGAQYERPARVERPAPTADAPAPRDRGNEGSDRGWDRPRRDTGSPPQPQPAAITPYQRDGRIDRNREGERLGNGNGAASRDDSRDGRDPARTNARRPDWNGRGDARRDWDRNNDGRPDRNRDGNGRRDWDRNNDGRPDWNGNGDGRRDWDRNNDGRQDWNRSGSWSRNDRNFRNWDRGWRTNNRYDWQRYRASNRNAFRLPRYRAPYNWSYGYRRQSIGAYLFAGLFARDYWIADPWAYRLPPVYWPYQWVRYYDDALLVDTRSGYVVDVIPDIFWY